VPSSMIFVGLVVIWLLILVPAIARHRQEVARPSTAALSGRVLERPRRRQSPEVEEVDDERPQVAQTDDHDIDEAASADDDRRWERPQPRYRRGRGGFDPEAAALTARARYAFRQRVVLTMLVLAVLSAIIALVVTPTVWWVHGGVDVALLCYLVYLRRQVRMEEAIRERRAARMAGTRRMAAAEDPDLDEWARRGREATRTRPAPQVDTIPDTAPAPEPQEPADTVELDLPEEPEPEPEPALPRLQPAPPPPLPAGTAVVEATDDDPDLYDLDIPTRPDYRRAVGE
jgi:hypothetical protein